MPTLSKIKVGARVALIESHLLDGDAYNRARLTPTVKGNFHRLMALKR